MLFAEISDKGSSPFDLLAISFLVAVLSGPMCGYDWISRVIGSSVVLLWDLSSLAILFDTTFLDAARLEFGSWYDLIVILAAIVPTSAAIAITVIALRKRQVRAPL